MQSEVARIRQQIAEEYRAAQLVFFGFSQVAKHEAITKHTEKIAEHFEELKKHIPEEEAVKILIVENDRKYGVNNLDN